MLISMSSYFTYFFLQLPHTVGFVSLSSPLLHDTRIPTALKVGKGSSKLREALSYFPDGSAHRLPVCVVLYKNVALKNNAAIEINR